MSMPNQGMGGTAEVAPAANAAAMAAPSLQHDMQRTAGDALPGVPAVAGALMSPAPSSSCKEPALSMRRGKRVWMSVDVDEC